MADPFVSGDLIFSLAARFAAKVLAIFPGLASAWSEAELLPDGRWFLTLACPDEATYRSSLRWQAHR